jgi:uncharacterized membrane protein (UPF0127 family)
MRIQKLAVLFFFLLLPASVFAEAVTYPVAPLAIITREGKINFTVEVATTEEQHENGLMFRKNLPQDHGMIFIFTPVKQVNFWMKNTLIPLDMLFVDNQGIVTQIAANAEPESTALISSTSEVRAVIELAGGTAAQDHIAKGDKVIYPIFP